MNNETDLVMREAATELVQSLVRVLKVRRMYDPGHPVRAETEEAALGRITPLLDEHGSIRLVIEKTRILCEEEAVFEQEEGADSLAYLLFREGLRECVLYPGLTAGELAAFVDHVSASARDLDIEYDLVARLWLEDLTHIRYAFVEVLEDQEWKPPAEDEEPETGAIELAEEDRAAVEKPEALQKAEETLYFLDDEDLAALQVELEAEKDRALVKECLTLFRELLFDPTPRDTAPLFRALIEIQVSMSESGGLEEILWLHQTFDDERLDLADAGEQSVLDELRVSALSADVVRDIADRLERRELGDTEVAAYVRCFGRPGFQALLEDVGDLKRICQRPSLAAAVADIASEEMDELRNVLAAGEPPAALAAAFLTGLLTDGRLLEALGQALESDDPAVRREVLLALKQFGGGRALEFVGNAVDDGDPSIRLYALRHLVTHRYTPALERVSRLLESSHVEERSVTERRLLYEAYGALGGEQVVSDLTDRLKRGSRFLFRKGDPEEMACAIVGLGATRTPAARKLVERALNDRQTVVRRTAEQVLDAWGDKAKVRA